MSPVVTVTFGNVSVRGRFLYPDGTMNMPALRAALELPLDVDLVTLNFRVPCTSRVTVTTDTWTLTVRFDD
ncbi:MAG: hypothetical protein KDB26_10930 [Microthrixaceae bacterium]|nr:hypothetical protein [Microthrixaceae bacterium]